MEIHFTKLAELINVHSSVSLHILHPDVLFKKYTRMNFMNKVRSKPLLQNTSEHTLLHKLHSGVLFAKYTLMYFHIKYTWMDIS